MKSYKRSNVKACPCGKGDQHSIAESGRCDAMRHGKLDEWQVKVGKRLDRRSTEGGR